MNTEYLQDILLNELGYTEGIGLETRISWPNNRAIPGINGVYVAQNIPLAYFSLLHDAQPQQLWELHRRVWNESKVPILYVVMPGEIRVYNSYAEPTRTPDDFTNDNEKILLKHLKQIIDVEDAVSQIRKDLHHFNRLSLETGAFWTTDVGSKIKQKNRADQRLLRGLDQLRRALIRKGLTNEITYALIGRTIFICYLQDRGVLSPDLVGNLTDGRSNLYRNALEDLETTFLFFERLTERFDGDIFPIDPIERNLVKRPHLDLVGQFLDGHDLESGQLHLPFWPYDFEYIPIELISGIYDTFLYNDYGEGASARSSLRRKLGAYYTPLSLVDFMVEETLPLEVAQPDMTILDPACGSGVFLVRAYQRLVESWKQRNHTKPKTHDLFTILQSRIFGVDIEPEAVRISTFSLYLAALDQLENNEIDAKDFRFPQLLGHNLFAGDFFSSHIQEQLSHRQFNRIMGNLPWGENTITNDSRAWLKNNQYIIADNQISQAFLLLCPRFCTDDGEIALLAPARGTVLGSSGPHSEFRQEFFGRYQVRAVVNFAALVYELFVSSLSPAVGIFYKNTPPDLHEQIVYGVPKPSLLSQRLGAIVLDATEVKYLDRENLLSNPLLWKIALWGTPRDEALINRLRSLPTLAEQAEQLGWKIGEGLQISNGTKPAPWLKQIPYLPTERFQQYFIDTNLLKPIEEDKFLFPRTPGRYKAPLVLIQESLCKAAFSEADVSYQASICGVVGQQGQEDLLKWLTAYINSPLVRYYQFLTSTRWAVERGNLLQREYETMPFLIPDQNDHRFKQVIQYMDTIINTLRSDDDIFNLRSEMEIDSYERDIAELIFDIYRLAPAERDLVNDTINYSLDFFYWSKHKDRRQGATRAVQRPDDSMLREYATTFVSTATAVLQYQNQTLNASIFYDGAPLSVVGFRLVSLSDTEDLQIIESSDSLRNLLRYTNSL
jgi:hypothetical protein